MIRGILFDMDGVLIDSEEYICRAAIEMFREKHVNAVPEDFLPFVGMGEDRYLGGVAEKYGLKADINDMKARTYAIYDKITRGNIKPLPGGVDFVKRCRPAGFRLALATSADRQKMEINLREMGLKEDEFDAVINGLEVGRKKPFPDIYILAAERIGLSPGECLVVEDAVSGVKAAKAAGCKCLAVMTSFPASDLAEADWICDSLDNIPEEAISW